MDLVAEDPGLNRGIAVHDPLRLVERDVENPYACPFAVVSDRADNRENAVSPERVIAPTMFPDDAARVRLREPVRLLHQHERVRTRLGLHLVHVPVGDDRHRQFLSEVVPGQG
jgi:hypothetical protein